MVHRSWFVDRHRRSCLRALRMQRARSPPRPFAVVAPLCPTRPPPRWPTLRRRRIDGVVLGLLRSRHSTPVIETGGMAYFPPSIFGDFDTTPTPPRLVTRGGVDVDGDDHGVGSPSVWLGLGRSACVSLSPSRLIDPSVVVTSASTISYAGVRISRRALLKQSWIINSIARVIPPPPPAIPARFDAARERNESNPSWPGKRVAM